MKRILSWVCTIPLLVAIGVSVLIWDPLLRMASLFGRRPVEVLEHVVEKLILSYFNICRLRIDVEIAPGFDRGARYVLVANHQSNFDIPLIGARLSGNRPKFVANRSLARGIPTVSFLLKKVGHGTIDLSKPREAIRDIRDFGHRVAELGASAVIFPEGTRARDGVLGDFRPAGTTTLIKTLDHLGVVPVAIDGAWHLMLHGLFPAPFAATVRLYVGEPIQMPAGSSPEQTLDACREVVVAKLDEWRSTNT